MLAEPNLLSVPIASDARLLGPGGTGVSTYARGLTEAISRLTKRPLLLTARPIESSALRWIEAVRPGRRTVSFTPSGDIGRLEGKDLFRAAHIHFSTWGTLYRLRSDLSPGIMHWTYPVPMVMEGWINLYTVHDAIPLERPDLTPIRAARHRLVLDKIQREANRILAVSDAGRNAIISALGCDANLVVNVGQAVEVTAEARAPIPRELRSKGYFLVVGSIEPRKNIAGLLAAYRLSGCATPLILVGPDGWRSKPILRDIAATPGATRLPYQTRAQLLGLIANARALLFPSLAEGFGLPLVEAMALGTPVMTSAHGALAEVAGGAAALVDPRDIESMARTITQLASDDAWMAQQAAAGLIRAGAYSMDHFTARLHTLYSDALRRTEFAAKALRP